MPQDVNTEFLEKAMMKTTFADKTFLNLFLNSVEPDYFANASISKIYKIVRNHWYNYNEIPTREIIENSFESDDIHEIKQTLEES